jgi:hypothetical protein
MATDRTQFESAEELWIEKYRAALKNAPENAPVQQSSFLRLWVALGGAYKMVSLQIERIVKRWMQAAPLLREQHGLAQLSEPPLVAEPTTSTRKMYRSSNGEQLSGEAKGTMAAKAS